jgi:microcystin-dependent protein
MKFLSIPRSLLVLTLAGALCATASGAAAQVTGVTGGGQPINNYQPSLVLNQLVPLQGPFPCRDCPGASAAHTLGSVRTFAGDFPIGGSATANGQIMQISQNTALFSLLGTTYGGNGQSTYGLPDLGGRAVIGAGSPPGYTPSLGEQAGQAFNTLTVGNLPAHDHDIPGGTTGLTGLGQPFDNGQPSLALNYQIAATGLFPGGGVDPFIGQIGMFAGNFEPGGWLQADGRLVSIIDYEPLFQLIGTTYGGDGQTNFALPNLVGRLAVGAGGGLTLGETFGQESTVLTDTTMPSHSHSLPGGGFTGLEGDGQPYDNAQPSLAINYLINLQGIFPSREGGDSLNQGLPFLGEIVGYAGDYVPNGWALANGQFLQINLNQALFSLLGTTYGGDGQTTFALPDLRGRTIVGSGGLFPLGQAFGNRFNTLNVGQLAPHLHTLPFADVPEPAEWLLLLGGFGMVGAALRRRRAAVA